MEIEQVLKEIRAREEIKQHAFIVGSWIWVDFKAIPNIETRNFLKSLGFRFNFKRKVWQFSNGQKARYSQIDPKSVYPMFSINEDGI